MIGAVALPVNRLADEVRHVSRAISLRAFLNGWSSGRPLSEDEVNKYVVKYHTCANPEDDPGGRNSQDCPYLPLAATHALDFHKKFEVFLADETLPAKWALCAAAQNEVTRDPRRPQDLLSPPARRAQQRILTGGRPPSLTRTCGPRSRRPGCCRSQLIRAYTRGSH